MSSHTSAGPTASADPQGHKPTAHGHTSPWLWVMCLTGVDYFSTLGYQPSIAFEATGRLAPLATLFLVFVTLAGAVPIYRYVAGSSPHGQGSIAMLERLVHGWGGKILILVLLGFAATDFVITKTLSAADAAEHLIHNPMWHKAPAWMHSQMTLTMLLLVFLGGAFMRGFAEVIWLAVVIVAVYLSLNLILVLECLRHLLTHPQLFTEWYQSVISGDWQIAHVPISGTGWGTIILLCFLFFPKLALGLSGFETGIAVMPLVHGDGNTPEERLAGRIQGTRKLLLSAAVIMSCFLICSSIITVTLIPAKELITATAHEDPNAARQQSEVRSLFQRIVDQLWPQAHAPFSAPQVAGDIEQLNKSLSDRAAAHVDTAPTGKAANRALAYIAHGESPHKISPLFGGLFGTIYDISTVVILWFAGASAMAGLLNLVPQYLPRYGMAPEWAAATRPLVVLFTLINLVVTWIFNADVLAQGAAYATGVLVLMSSAAIATVIEVYRSRTGSWIGRWPWGYSLIGVLFLYTTVTVIIERPGGIQIASFFILAVLVSSIWSRTVRSTEMRFTGFRYKNDESHFLWDSMRHLEFPILVPHRPGGRDLAEKEASIRREHHFTKDDPIVFIEVERGDVSEFYQSPELEVTQEGGRIILRFGKVASIPHVIAAVGLELSKTGRPPEIHFGWSNESPLAANVSFVLFGEGNVPWMVRELIRKAESDITKQPRVVVG
jgi:hypothetical protein